MSAVTQEQLRAIRADIDAALVGIKAKHGLSELALGTCTYDPNGPFKFQLKGVGGGGKTRERIQYEMEAKYVFLPPLDQPFTYGAETFVPIGVRGTKVEMTRPGETKVFVAKIDAVSKAYTRAHPEKAKAFNDTLFAGIRVEARP